MKERGTGRGDGRACGFARREPPLIAGLLVGPLRRPRAVPELFGPGGSFREPSCRLDREWGRRSSGLARSKSTKAGSAQATA